MVVRTPEQKVKWKEGLPPWPKAKKLILSQYHVSEDIRRERRRRNPVKRGYLKSQGTALLRTNEAAVAPQPVKVTIPEN